MLPTEVKLINGVLPLYAPPDKPAVNTREGVTAAATTAKLYIDSDYLREKFFTPNPTILHTFELASGGQVTAMIPSAPYGEGGMMVIAAGKDSLTPGFIKTEVVYDFPEDVQTTYWAVVMYCLSSFANDLYKDATVVLATENCMAHITNEQERNSRSVRLPHIQIFPVQNQHIYETEWTIDHLEKEKALFSRPALMAGYLYQLEKRYWALSKNGVPQFNHTLGLPTGYAFKVGEIDDVETVTEVMRTHHQAYTAAAQRAVGLANALIDQKHLLKEDNKRMLITQPSYRLYLTVVGREVQATIAPELISHGGVMESIGIQLDRNAQNPRRISEIESQSAYDVVRQGLRQMDTAQQVANF